MDNIRKHLDQVDVLPPAPTLLPQLIPKLSDVDANFGEIVELITLDPALTSKLLQICNSAYFGQKTEVKTVAEAVSHVGYQSVYLLVAMINGSACFPVAPGFDADKLWQHSITTAFNAKFVAESAGVDGNLLFTAGILHDLGKVILSREKATAASGLFGGLSDKASLARENEVFGCNHADLGAALLERWKLPAQIVVAVRYHHEPKAAPGFQRIAACVSLGNFVTHSLEQPKIINHPEFTQNLDMLGLSVDNLEHWHERLRGHQNLLTGLGRLPL